MRFDDLSVVLLPGLDGSGRLFQEFITALAASVPMFIATYPHHAEWEISDYVDHIEQSLPADENLLVIAESFSGPLTLELLRRRSNIKALVLVASFTRCPNPLLNFIPFIPVAAAKPFLQSTFAIRSFCLGDDATPDQVAALKSVIKQLPTDVLKGRLGLLRHLDIESGSIPDTLPILYLRADKDRLVCRSSAPDFSHKHPDSRIAMIDGPHFLLQARAQDCAKAIRNWMDSVGNNAA